MERLLFAYDEIFLKHDTGMHPENYNRLIAINSWVAKSALNEQIDVITPRKAEKVDILRIHDEKYIDSAVQRIENGEVALDIDTSVSKESAEAAYFAAGAGLTCADKIIAGDFKRAFCSVRPPGHHAERTHSMGFCIFNNVAITAKYLQQVHGIDKILILDWDVHHGNGTEHSFYTDPSVMYISLHQYPFYPGTGAKTDTGVGAGLNYNLNFPMNAGSGNHEYFTAFNERILPEIRRYNPDFILISAGFDAHQFDPLASINLNSEAFGEFTKMILSVAEHAEGRIISFLEGGYNLEVLGESVLFHIEILINDQY